MFETIVLIISIGLVIFFGYVIYLMSEGMEQLENQIEFYTEWYETFIERLSDANDKMAQVDKRGSFSSDDEIGFAYTTVKECIEDLVEMGVITYDEDRQTEGGEEIQGKEEEE